MLPYFRAVPALVVLATLTACQRTTPDELGKLPPAPTVERPVLRDSPPQPALVEVTERVFVDPDPQAPDALTPPSASAALSGRDAEGAVLEFPLEHTRVDAQVSGNVARVELTQLYRNPGTTRLEAVYAFPLPPNAAVTDMYFRIGNRIVYSVVQRKEEARRTYEAAKSEGKAAALTEQERPNLFTQSVANIPPGEAVAVVIRYVHEVPFDAGRYVFHVPTTIGPRYIPGARADGQPRVPDAARITPPTVVGEGVRSTHDLAVTVRLAPGAAFEGVASRNHRVVSGMDGSGARLVALAEDDRRPNKDFVLSYRAVGAKPRAYALVERERGDDYLMLFVQPPVNVGMDLVRPKELVFLLDKSGSMMGSPLETSKDLVLHALRRMGKHDTFQLVAFDGGAYRMSDRPLANTPENLADAEAWLRSLSGGGGTEMLNGILHALSPSEDPDRLRMVIFCTDAFIGNEYEILSAIRERRKSARVFAFGIGSSVNRYLIEGMAREGRGAADYVSYGEAPEVAVQRLYAKLDRPVLTDLELSFDGLEVSELQPQNLPDLFAGQPLVVAGRYRKTGATGAVVLSGRMGTEAYRERIPIETASSRESQAVLGTLWARRSIEELTMRAPGSPSPDTVEEIVKLGLKFKLITPYTSFVAVERELRTDPGVPLTTVLVPNELPEGVSAEGIFGDATTTAEVLPNRVKPGDPELRIRTRQTAAAVRVLLPFEFRERDAEKDATTGEYVLRFLVPSGWPDGSYDARITVHHLDGTVEHRTAPIRVDTAAPSLLATRVKHGRAGQPLTLAFKPALSVGQVLGLAFSGRAGGGSEALKAAMDVKEVLVRAPWGEVVTAAMEGPFGEYRATVNVPELWAREQVELEVVASDAAGNIHRSHVPVQVDTGARSDADLFALACVALVLLGGARLLERPVLGRLAGVEQRR